MLSFGSSKTFILVLFNCLVSSFTYGQVIFSESFDEAVDATTGTDEEGGVNWETSCDACLDTGDFFKVTGGKLVGQDTNGPGVWETDLIDISSCDFIEIELEITEEGDLEACGTGCNSVDYIQLEYNIDGAGWVSPADAYLCAGDCADVLVIHSDDIDGGVMTYGTGCMLGGDNIQLRITIQAWAASERWKIDDVSVSCASGPTVSAGDDFIICEGDEVTLIADNPDLAILSWDGGVVDGVSFEPLLGAHVYTVTATDGACFSTDEIEVTVTELTIIALDPAGPFGEMSGTHLLTAAPLGGEWSATCGDCIDELTGVFNPELAGVGIWEVCYAAGEVPCNDVVCMLVEVTDDCPLVGEISTTNPTCYEYEDGFVSIEMTGTFGAVSYIIRNEAGLVVNEGNDNYATGLPGGWYYFEVTDAFPCAYLDSIELIMPSELAVDLFLQSPLCFGDSNGFAHVDTVYNYAGSYEDLAFTWMSDGVEWDGFTEWNDLADGEYALLITDGLGCTSSTIFELFEPDSLVLNEVSHIDIACFGMNSGAIHVEASGGMAPYLYSMDGDIYEAVSNFDDLFAGSYTLSVLDANGCEATTLVELIEPDSFVVNITTVNEVCAGDCQGEIVMEALGEFEPFLFSIDGCISTFEEGTFTGLCAGEKTICVLDQNGCSQNYLRTILPGSPVMDGTFSPIGSLCLNDSPVALVAPAIGVLSGDGILGATFNPSLAGVGEFLIINQFDGLCTISDSIVITVNPIPEVDFTADKIKICQDNSIQFLSTADSLINYVWDFGDGITLTGSNNINHTFTDAGFYDVRLKGTALNGCVNEIIKPAFIQVLEQVVADFTFNESEITTLNSTAYFTNLSLNSDEWEWDLGGLITSTAENPIYVFPEEEMGYEIVLIAKNTNGCSDTVSQFLEIVSDNVAFIPNAITIDGDQFNNVFKPYFKGINIFDYDMFIYNRWGELIFESHDPAVGWDGTYGGQLVEQGVYIYQIQTTEENSGKKVAYNGHLTVLK